MINQKASVDPKLFGVDSFNLVNIALTNWNRIKRELMAMQQIVRDVRMATVGAKGLY